MNKFSQLNIKAPERGFEGQKIKMNKILGKEIIVYFYKITDSKAFPDRGTGKCLQLQIEHAGEKHVLFTGATGLIQTIQLIPEDAFPFATTIEEQGDRFLFT